MDKITLTEEKETLLITLFGKAMENKKKNPILIDRKAVDIVNQIDYDFASLNIAAKTNIMMCIRAKLIDDFVKDQLTNSSENIVLHLGCGLDSRYNRMEDENVDWYDLDFPEVIDIRRQFFQETDKYHMIPSSVTEYAWLEHVPEKGKQYIVIAEGLFMYLPEEEIKILIKNMRDRFGPYTLIFDVFSVLTAGKMKNHPSLKKTRAVIHWGIDDVSELEQWEPGIELKGERYFTSNEEIKKLDIITKTIFKLADLFPMAKKAHRILIYEIG